MMSATHPADQLIRDLLDHERPVGDEEIAAIVARLASAPFSEQIVSVPRKYRKSPYVGWSLGERERSLRLHLVLRVVGDRQRHEGTTEESYVRDLHAAARDPASRLIIYQRRGGVIAAALAQNTMQAERLGAAPLPLLYVVYSADRSTLISGYQFSAVSTISIPGDARWLR